MSERWRESSLQWSAIHSAAATPVVLLYPRFLKDESFYDHGANPKLIDLFDKIFHQRRLVNTIVDQGKGVVTLGIEQGLLGLFVGVVEDVPTAAIELPVDMATDCGQLSCINLQEVHVPHLLPDLHRAQVEVQSPRPARRNPP